MTPLLFILTCEHARNHIPREYASLFSRRRAFLQTHRGWDRGALKVAQVLAQTFHWPALYGENSRLLVDLNRTPDHPGIFSLITKSFSLSERERLLTHYHEPYWEKARQMVRQRIQRSFPVCHLSIHSFTPVFHGHRRSTGIGLLFDPSREREKMFCQALRSQLQKQTKIKIHFNLPYRGTGNGVTTQLKSEFKESKYLGIEIEINQKYLKTEASTKKIAELLKESLKQILKSQKLKGLDA